MTTTFGPRKKTVARVKPKAKKTASEAPPPPPLPKLDERLTGTYAVFISGKSTSEPLRIRNTSIVNVLASTFGQLHNGSKTLVDPSDAFDLTEFRAATETTDGMIKAWLKLPVKTIDRVLRSNPLALKLPSDEQMGVAA
jgi:hypothetical protein